MTETSNPFIELFENPEHAAQYADGPARFMPGYQSVQRMAGVLIREHAPADAHVLVHGAGGGLEIEAFAAENPQWSFVGVDPAQAMLDEASARLRDFGDRVALHHGFAEDAPAGPFDAATSMLTLHFIPSDERRETIAEIVKRLKPGSPFVAAHCSFPRETRELWMTRHREFVVASGGDPEEADKARESILESLEVLDPDVDAQILRDAGLTDVTMFYSAFTWRGWVGRAS